MSIDLSNDIENSVTDELFAKAKEESLRFYNEVELPRLGKEKDNENEEDSNSSQFGGKTGPILYDGADATGFHLDAGKTYIYPTNYPVRQYQATMVKTALFKNTLISLPTGLGKTFIAAVVMYNFYRWYPNGKIVFMAPTRPLVAQQTKACHHIMNIPVDHTAELTGMQNAELRKTLWKEKRVFYLTPQVMVNDLKSKTCPASLIRCIVIDEAHRATKDYAYCQVLKLLSEEIDALFRVLGLSATPGNDINAVQHVVRNLRISALEIRSEDSLDVAPYTHSRSVNTVVVELSGNILRVRDDLLQVYEKYAKRLKDFKALPQNIATVSKFQILKACEKFRANPPKGVPPSVIGNLISDFTVCMSLAHSLELLQIYGLRAFYTYLSDENSEKAKNAAARLRNDEDLKEMLKRLQACLFPKEGKEGSFTWSHPKLKDLVTAITEHFEKFQSEGGSTKAIIFCQYRVVVSEIVELLNKFKPLIKATEFVGQSGGKEKGMPQAKQLQIMKDFRNGIINCLVATCVAEEGLDIGEVDLIILMEAHKSPVRLVQRMGRTGRKRKGYCLVLLTKGREEQKFHEAMATRKFYVENIIKSPVVKASLCQDSPRMIPIQFSPVQQLVHINVTTFVSPAKPQIKKQADIRKCFSTSDSPFLPDNELLKVVEELGQPSLTFNLLPKNEKIWYRRFDNKFSIDELLSKGYSKFSEWNEWNHEEQETYYIDHTSHTKLLCHILKLASKEIELPDFEATVKPDANAVAWSHNGDYVDNDSEAKKCTSPNKKKRSKKDCVKKNLGQDIRNCLALTMEKKIETSSVPVHKQIKDIISDEGGPTVDVISSETLSVTPNIFQIKIGESKHDYLTDLYMDENNALNSIDKFIPSVINSSKTWACMHNLPKLETFFDDVTVEVIENLIFSCELSKNSNESNILKKNQEVALIDFVEIDDLFDTESNNDKCLNTAIYKFYENKENVEYNDHVKAEEKVSNHVTAFDGVNNSKIINPSNKLSSSLNKKNETSIIHLHTSEMHQFNEKVNCSSNSVTKLKYDVTKTSCLVGQEENHTISTNNYSSPHDRTKPDFVSSTPNPKVKNFKKNKIKLKSSAHLLNDDNEKHDEHINISSDSSEMWNLSDLFEEGEIKNGCQNRNIPFNDEYSVNCDIINGNNSFDYENNFIQNSTMLGITQMVSLIEKEKVQIKHSDCKMIMNSNSSAENNLGLQEQLAIQTKNDLSDYLDCDVEIFSQLNDEPVMSEHSLAKTKDTDKEIPKECFTDIQTSHISEFNKSLHINESKNSLETKLFDNNDNLTDNNTCSQIFQGCTVVNFKKFAGKKTLFSRDKNTQDNFNQKCPYTIKSKSPPIDEHSEEILFSTSQKPNILHKDGGKIPLKSKLVSETCKVLMNESKIGENELKKSLSSNTKSTKTDQNKRRTGLTFGKQTTLNVTDSDESDVFEPLFYKKKRNLKKRKEDFCKVRKTTDKRKGSNDFIDREAEVDSIAVSSDDSDGSSLDDVDNSFINDDSEYISNNTQAIYLKSVKSPLNKGNFKIPDKKVYFENVYSQQVEEDSEYINDSFCVESEDEDGFANSMSLLEIAEQKLEMKNNSPPPKKRRRILNSQDDSSPEKPPKPFVTMSQPSPKQTLKYKKRRIIQSDSEGEVSPLRKKHLTSLKNSDQIYHPKNTTIDRKENFKQHNYVINLSSDEDNSKFVHVKEKVVDLTIDSNEDDSDLDFEQKFQEDLREAIIRSQSDFMPLSTEKMSHQTSTPKTDRKILDLKKLDKSVHELNKRFSERLEKIKNKFCTSDESFDD